MFFFSSFFVYISKHRCQWASLHDHSNFITGSNWIWCVYMHAKKLMFQYMFQSTSRISLGGCVRSDKNVLFLSNHDLILYSWVLILINRKFGSSFPESLFVSRCYNPCLLSQVFCSIVLHHSHFENQINWSTCANALENLGQIWACQSDFS